MRFEREMRSLARLNDPNIAALHNAIHAKNELILMMEYLEGQTLESLFHAGRFPLIEGIKYVKQVLAALGYAHRDGVVHRDLNPANVMITSGGQAKLMDFGLSKSYGDSLLTNCGEVLGSLPYMAPEQVKGTTQPDRRSDLYSAGAIFYIFYEHLTGRTPFGAKRRLAAVITDTEADPQPPSQFDTRLSAQWDEIVQRALARDPVHRYQSAEEFLTALARLEEPAVADLPLPRLGTLGIGVALFAGVILVLVASPWVKRLLPPTAIAVQRFHIAPPPFAIVVPHTVRAISPLPVVETSSHQRVSRARHIAEPARGREFSAMLPAAEPALATPVPAGPSFAVTEKPQPAAVLDQGAPNTSAVSDETESSPTTTPHKKHFWSKWNVFRNRRSASEEETEGKP